VASPGRVVVGESPEEDTVPGEEIEALGIAPGYRGASDMMGVVGVRGGRLGRTREWMLNSVLALPFLECLVGESEWDPEIAKGGFQGTRSVICPGVCELTRVRLGKRHLYWRYLNAWEWFSWHLPIDRRYYHGKACGVSSVDLLVSGSV